MQTRGPLSPVGLPCALLGLALTLPMAAQKADKRLSTNPSGTRIDPQIAASGLMVYVTWHDRRNGFDDIYFNRSRDGGATWLASEVRLDTDPPGSAGSSLPQIAASGSSVYVTWADTRNGAGTADIYLNRSTDGGATWLTSDVQLNTNAPGAAFGPQIATSGSAVYVTWVDNRNSISFLGDIYFNGSPDGGVTWLASDVRLDTDSLGTAASRDPQIATSGSAVYVAWEDDRNGGTYGGDIYCNRSLDGGMTWRNSDVRLDTNAPGAAWSFSPQLAAWGSTVCVTWMDFRNTSLSSGRGDIYCNRSLDGGTTWLPSDKRLDTDSPGAAKSGDQQIEMSGPAVYVTWEDGRNARLGRDIRLNRSLDGGTTWLNSDVRVDTGEHAAGDSVDPQIAAVGTNVFVTWTDHRNLPLNTGDTYFSHSQDGGATWLAANVRLSTDPPGTALQWVPQITASGSSVYVTWADHRNSYSSPDVYFNIPFGFQPYDPPTPGTGGIAPQLASTGSATISSTPTLDVTNGLGSAPGVLFLGAKTSVPVIGGTLLVLPAVTIPLGLDATGASSLPLAIPNDEAFVGGNVNFQAVFLDAGAPQGVSMTNGVEMWIG